MTGRQKVMGAGLLTGQGNGYRVDKIRNLYRMMLCDTYFFFCIEDYDYGYSNLLQGMFPHVTVCILEVIGFWAMR